MKITSAKDLFEKWLPAALAANPSLVTTDKTFVFDVDGAGKWTVDFASQSPCVQPGAAVPFDVTIAIREEDLLALLENEKAATQFYFMGKLKVVGDPMLALKVGPLFKAAREAAEAAGA